MPQYDRFAVLTVGQPGQDGALIEGLRIQFSIKKTEMAQPNTSAITVYNLQESVRNKLGTTGNVAILKAGYKQAEELQRIICEMDVVDAQTTVSEPEVSTALVCGDGVNKLRTVKTSKSFIPGKSAKDILAEVVADAGMTLRSMGEIADEVFDNGFSEAGPLNDILTKLSGKLAARWSIQNGEVQLTPIGQPADDTVLLLDNSTGLIGPPQRRNKVGALETPGQKDGWIARSLLFPPAEPGSRVRLHSEISRIDAVFKVVAVQHTGDTHGQEWYTDLELEEFD